QPHHADAAGAPGTLGTDPAEVVDAHAFAPVAENAENVARALGAKVHVGGRVREDAARRQEMLDLPRAAGRDGRRPDELPGPLRRAPVDESRLNLRAAVDEHEVLRP